MSQALSQTQRTEPRQAEPFASGSLGRRVNELMKEGNEKMNHEYTILL